MTTNEDFWESAKTLLERIKQPTNESERELDVAKFRKLRGLFIQMDDAVCAVLKAIERVESEEPDA